MNATVIMHFYNEAYLLPWWLKHHRLMFAHGVLIDYNSSDASRALCQELVPDWELRRSRNSRFSAVDVDAEVMDIERGLTGWKMALNATEFLLTSRPLNELLAEEPSRGLRTRPVVLVDAPDAVDVDPLPDIPFLRQRVWGYHEGGLAPTRSRLLHRHADGSYLTGRHEYLAPSIPTTEIVTAWLQFSPMTPQGRQRKTQIAPQIPLEDREAGWGWQHYNSFATEEGIWREYEEVAARAGDLTELTWYAQMIRLLPEVYGETWSLPQPISEPALSRLERQPPMQDNVCIPLITMVVVSDNQPERLLSLLHCLLAQSIKDIEIVVVNNGPAEVVRAAVHSIGSPSIVYEETPARRDDSGVACKALGTKVARGRFIGHTKDTSYFVPIYLEEMVVALIRSGADFAYCDMVHSHLGYASFNTHPAPGRIDGSGWLCKAELVKSTAWPDHTDLSRIDGHYAEALAARSNGIVKVPGLLFVHN